MCEPPSYPGPVDVAPGEKVPQLFILIELAEAGMEPAGRILRQTLRAVRAWMEEGPGNLEPPPEEGSRAGDAVPELSATLPPLWRLLREAPLDHATFEAVALACLHVANWAENAAAYRTALAFFQAAEDLDADNPHCAYNVGRMARKLALYDAAEAWLKWAHWIARVQGEWEVATLALSGLGNLHRQRGNLPAATRYHKLTWRVARRRNLRTLEGDALYDLAGMSFDFGEMKLGMEYTRKALAAYGPGHGRVYTLARDLAWMWMDRYGQFDNAAHVFKALLDHIWEPSDRLLLFANLARAAAGAGWSEVFETMWIETWAIMRQQSVRYGHAGALIQLAYGAGNLGFWSRAQIAATEAFRVARERKEGEMIIAAEAILDAVRNGVIAEDSARAIFRDRSRAPREILDHVVSDLASELTHAMRVRRDEAPAGPAATLAPGEG